MDRREAISKVEEAARRRGKVQFERVTAAGHSFWNGIPLHVNDQLVLVATLDQFRFDGFAVFRWEEVCDLHCGDNERFFERVLRSEGLIERLPRQEAVRLDAWSTVLEDVRERHRHLIIECENSSAATFHIGELARVQSDAAFVRYVQANGIKDAKPTRIALGEITMVRWAEHYVEMYGKYSVCETHH